jgi:methylglyoxal synthase
VINDVKNTRLRSSCSPERHIWPLAYDMGIDSGLTTIAMRELKRLALIAHDNCKGDLLDWARFNRGTLAAHDLYATGTTGALLATELGLPVVRFLSGPLGGDQQVGAAIVEGRLDFVIFFWDPLEPHPHDVDVKALLRIAVVYNIPIACNRATADFLLSSPLMERAYERRVTRRHSQVTSLPSQIA